MSFRGIVLTDDGKNELAAAEMGGSFRITHIIFGDGMYSGERSAVKAVVHPIMSLPVSKIERDQQVAGRVIIECDFNSMNVPKAFYWREIGIVANEKLCYYDNAGNDAEYFDPVTETVIKQKRMRILLQISSDVSVNIKIGSELYATDESVQKILQPEYDDEVKLEQVVPKDNLFVILGKLSKGLAELINHLKAKDNPHGITAEHVGLGKASNTPDAEKSVKYATSAGSAAKDGKGNNIADTYAATKELKEVAFSGSYNDLRDTPTIPAAVAVKGAAETAYRTGNVNITPANLGLGKVQNTADSEKSVKYATSAGSAAKDGKGNNIADTYLAKTGDAANATVAFTQAATRANIATGEKLSGIMGKIRKWFADMTAAAFAQIITSNADLMATTVSGYLVDALAVKNQFQTVDSYLDGLCATAVFTVVPQLAAGGYQTYQVDVAKDGYTPVGIVGYEAGSIEANIFKLDIPTGSSTASVGVSNRSATSTWAGKNVQISFRVLYIKTP